MTPGDDEPRDDPRLNYADPAVRQAIPGRPLRAWVVLLGVWSIGLVIWAAYLIAIGYLALKVL
jgi:hypothetical protein